MDRAIKKAYEKISYVSCNEEELRIYAMRERAQMDYDIDMTAACCEGLEKGRQKSLRKGRQKGRQEALSEMLKLFKAGKSVEEISKLLNLPDENESVNI